jgi:hypothetical protein
MRRPIQMQPLGNMHVCRPQRVGSSTNPRPTVSNSGTIGSVTDGAIQSVDGVQVNGAMRHIMTMAESGDITMDEAASAMNPFL